MVDIPRLKNLYKLTREIDASRISGDIVECGVYNGGSAAVMAYATKQSLVQRRIWLFDSFQGIPKPTSKDGSEAYKQYQIGWLKGEVEKVKEIFEKLKIDPKKVQIIKGWFQDTFRNVTIPQIALLHIDADWYESVKLCLERFYDSVETNGYIVLDDYGCWEGCRKATDEFIKTRNLNVKLIQIDWTACYFQKSD